MPAKALRSLEPPPTASTLGGASKGARGVVLKVGAEGVRPGGLEPSELERRLLEIGFVEGARFELVHEGLFGRDPIAVKLDDMTVALRRREAASVLVRLDGDDLETGFAEAAE
ncbi:MAG TPA: FeoA family protein [Caulobacteraceae bacterium]|nr:FeoA family protein [Caulobacteraceae bacterium]